ncbi:elongin-B-like [Puntigrus tetrazona]|uniref:elongin-B-like n=1 Tax=Puntigrus tetrazona TaxID=1606681 RepID=UPI001C8A26C5|nr:elongin-B-like [Puntigrus tetrazona]
MSHTIRNISRHTSSYASGAGNDVAQCLFLVHCGIVEGCEVVNGGYRTAKMDVFLMIRRHKTTIFTEAKESTTVYELKQIVEGILKRSPEEQRLYKDEQPLEDNKTLGDCGFTNQTARPQAPATVGLAFRISDDAFETLQVESFSSPPELPDVMKPQDSGSTANEQSVQ